MKRWYRRPDRSRHRFSTAFLAQMILALRALCSARFVRFLLVGLTTTATSYLLFVVLLLVVHQQVAYAFAFVAGLAMGYLLNTRWVFAVHHSGPRLVMYPAVYLPQLLLGGAALQWLTDFVGLDPRVAILMVIAGCVPLNYLLMKLVFSLTWRPSKIRKQ